MSTSSAIVFVPDDSGRTGLPAPLMLSPAMGVPLLRWLSDALVHRGVSRFFLVCHSRYLEQAKACFPAGADVTISSAEDAPDELHVFLSTADDQEDGVTVVTGPAVCLPGASPIGTDATNVHRVSRQSMMAALDDRFSFLDFLVQSGVALTEDFLPVASAASLRELQPALRRARLADLAESGVQIYDFDSCWVEPGVIVASGVTLMPGTILRGKTVICENCVIGPNALLENTAVGAGSTVNASQAYDSFIGADTKVGPFAYIRPGSKIGSRVKVGDFVEIKNSNIGDGTKISHLTYVGDTDLGRDCNLGCGTVTVNYDGVRKYRTVIEDDCFIGCNTNLVAPVTVGRGAYTAAGSTVTDDVPAGALAIARARQSNKRDWVAKRRKK